ncbi:MAG: cache domain-containing protein [Cyanobacteria bacterium J06639_14]
MHSFSIRKTIPLLIVTPLVVAIGFIGTLSIYYGQRSVNQLSEDLMQSTTNRIQDQLTGLLQEAVLLNRLNTSAIASGELDLQQRRDWGRYFSNQLLALDATNYIYFGNEAGYFVGSRIQNGKRFSVFSGPDTKGRTYQYDVDESGNLSSEPSRDYEYDPRQRPWYEAAIAAKQPVWSDVYLGFTARELLITAAHPIYDSRDQLIGVMGVDMFTREINRFLEDLEVGQTGEVFIMEQTGMLVASSIGETITTSPQSPTDNQDADDITRVSAFDSPEIVVSDTANHLLEEYGDLSLIRNNIRITHSVDDQRTFIAARPLRDHTLGLDWLIVVAIPTRDFTGPLRTQTLITLIFASVVLAMAVGLGWLVARWIASPLMQLHAAAVNVKSQSFNPAAVDHLAQRDDEIGQFAGVFSEMAEIISEREESLEEQLKYLRLRAPLPDIRRSLDLTELQTLQRKAKVIREMSDRG